MAQIESGGLRAGRWGAAAAMPRKRRRLGCIGCIFVKGREISMHERDANIEVLHGR